MITAFTLKLCYRLQSRINVACTGSLKILFLDIILLFRTNLSLPFYSPRVEGRGRGVDNVLNLMTFRCPDQRLIVYHKHSDSIQSTCLSR